MRTHPNTERGQAMVLIVLAIVALLGFTALAVDTSMVYADRRYAQSASDAAAMAGVTEAAKQFISGNISENGWSCTSTTIKAVMTAARTAAIKSATGNNYALAANLANHHGATATCVNTATDKYIEVTVEVTEETSTGFMHLLSKQKATNTTTAVARARPSSFHGGSYTIIAMNPASCSGLKNGALFNGNTRVYVCGGGMISNGCMRGSGMIMAEVRTPSCGSVASNGAYYVKDLRINPDPNAQIFPDDLLADTTATSSFAELPASLPEDPFNFREAGRAPGLGAPLQCHISPYPVKTNPLPENFCQLPQTPEQMCAREGANHITGSDLKGDLDPGLYCVTGDAKLSGSKGSLSGTNVTIVFLEGGLSCTGNCKLQLRSPKAGDTSAFPAEPGLLFYSLDNAAWKLNGNNVSYFYGSIFAPKADIEMMGTGNENGFFTQVCAWNFHTGGTNDSKFKYDENYRIKRPPEVEMTR